MQHEAAGGLTALHYMLQLIMYYVLLAAVTDVFTK